MQIAKADKAAVEPEAFLLSNLKWNGDWSQLPA